MPTDHRPGSFAGGARERGEAAALILTALVGFALCIFEASDSDLGFHLATGRAILESGSIPTTNLLSFAEPDHAWALHQWFPALLFEISWSTLGEGGPTWVKACVVALTLLASAATARRLGASPTASAVVVLAAACAASYRYVERPLIFSGLMLAATLLALARADALHARGDSRGTKLFLGAATLAAAAAWHLHAGALFIDVALIAVALGLVVDGYIGRAGVRDLRPALAVGGVALVSWLLALVSLASYRQGALELMLFPLQMAADPFLHEHLIEFRPPYELPLIYTGAFFVVGGLAAIAIAARARAMPVWALLLALMGAAMALRHARLVDSFAILVVPACAIALRELPPRLDRALPLALIALMIGAPALQWTRVPPGLGLNPDIWPLELTATLRERELRGPIFASDAWAGPLLGLLFPSERAFFDPRFEAYSRTHWRDAYLRTRDGEDGYAQTLDRFGIELVMLKHTSAGEARRQGGAPNLRQHLAADPAWALVAFDTHGSIFVRAAGVNREAARSAIVGVDPDRGLFLGARPSAALPTLSAAWDRGPRSSRLAAMVALALGDAGDVDRGLLLLSETNAAFPDDPALAQAARRLARMRGGAP